MKDEIRERLILLASAQECMTNVTTKMEAWDASQLTMEKSAYEIMNTSDDVLRFTREGSLLAGKLMDCCRSLMDNPCMDIIKNKDMAGVLEELNQVFANISEASAGVSDLAHKLEEEVEVQKELEESVKICLGNVGECVNSVLACEELVMASVE